MKMATGNETSDTQQVQLSGHWNCDASALTGVAWTDCVSGWCKEGKTDKPEGERKQEDLI